MSKPPNMTTFKCMVHNVHFAAESITDKTVRCPYCCDDEIVRLRDARDEYKAQRDKLLAAIDVSRLVEAQG